MKDPNNSELTRLITRFPALESCSASVAQARELLNDCFKNGNALYLCGNGGSASDSAHIAGELAKGFNESRELNSTDAARLSRTGGELGAYLAKKLQYGFRAIDLTAMSSLMTAVVNDTAGDMIFAQQVYAYGKSGDVLWCISTSGNSRNVLLAAVAARAKGMKVLSLTGPKGGALAEHSDVLIKAPGEDTPSVQESHLPIYHALCAQLEIDFYRADHRA